MLLCFGFCAFDFESLPHPSFYLTSIVDETHHGPVIAPFLRNFCNIFSSAGGVLVSKQPTFFHLFSTFFGYSGNCNTRRAFVIIFLISKNLLNYLKMCWHHSHDDRKWLKQPQSHFHWAIPHKATIFRCFDLFSVRPPQIFQVQAKTSTIQPIFPDYLSVSYDYGLC